MGAFVQALTGRPLDTLGQAPAPAPAPAPPPSRPLSAEEILGATQASQPGMASEGPPPITVTATTHRPGDPPAGQPAPARRAWWPLALGGGVVLAVLAGGLLLGRGGGGVGERRAAGPAPRIPAVPVEAKPAMPPAPKPAEEHPPQPPTPAAADDDAAAEPALPREAAEHLREGERLLEQGDASAAIRRAHQSFYIRKSNRGWALLTRAFCRKGDLENARASFRNIRPRSPERTRALRACRAADIDLR
jgi:serine/threonine-protein kinase